MDSTKYNFSCAHRGVAVVIINVNFERWTGQKERKNQEREIEPLINVLEAHGFEVRPYINQTTTEMLQIVTKVTKQEDHSDRDCFMLFLSSHGDFEYSRGSFYDLVWGTDGYLLLDQLLEPFQSKNCKSLANKPKLFFLQACRGVNLEQKVKVLSLAESGRIVQASPVQHEGSHIEQLDRRYPPEAYALPYRVPIYKDFFLAYATPPGFAAFKTPEGSPFFKYFCERLAQEGATTDLMTLMTRVSRDVAEKYETNAPSKAAKGHHGRKMMPWIASMLTKDIIFTPKGED